MWFKLTPSFCVWWVDEKAKKTCPVNFISIILDQILVAGVKWVLASFFLRISFKNRQISQMSAKCWEKGVSEKTDRPH